MQKNNETTGNPNPWRRSRPEQNDLPIKSSCREGNSSKYSKHTDDGNPCTERKSQNQTQLISAVKSSLNHKSLFRESDKQSEDDIIPYASRIKIPLNDFQKKKSSLNHKSLFKERGKQSEDDIIPYASRIKIPLSDFQKKKLHFEKKQQHSQQWRLKNKHMKYGNFSDDRYYSANDKYGLQTIEIPELRLEETNVERNEMPNNPDLLDNTKDSTAVPVIMSSTNDTAIIQPDLKYDSDASEGSGDLKKLEMMTAIDFNRDRYARFEVHESEMKDYVRTITYKNCLEYCSDQYIKNKIVLVVRCGLGLLPMLCVRSGLAKRVIALEESACIEYARRVVKDNMYSNEITLIQSSVHDLKELPHGLRQVDVIVSDFMGDCVLSQGNEMEQVIEARDRFLKPNGLMIPMCITLYGQLSEQRRAYENRRSRKFSKKNKNKALNNCVVKNKEKETIIDGYDTDSSSDSTWCSWWSDVYGFDMRSKPEFLVNHFSERRYSSDFVLTEPIITFFDPYKVVSTAAIVKEFDMYKCTIPEARYVQCKDLKLKCSTPYTSAKGGDYAQMLELFMVVDFPNGKQLSVDEDAVPIGFSTSSFSPNTRYAQTGLLLRDQLIVREGDDFIINEFHMWRGPQENEENKLFEGTVCENTCNKKAFEENLKIRLSYTFVNKYNKAIDRRCAYILVKKFF